MLSSLHAGQGHSVLVTCTFLSLSNLTSAQTSQLADVHRTAMDVHTFGMHSLVGSTTRACSLNDGCPAVS